MILNKPFKIKHVVVDGLFTLSLTDRFMMKTVFHAAKPVINLWYCLAWFVSSLQMYLSQGGS